MKLFIPSKNRPSIPVFKLLSEFDKDDIYIFVEPQDYDKYKLEGWADKAHLINIEKNDKWFGYVLDYMNKFAKELGLKHWLFLDDDIQGFEKRTEGTKLVNITKEPEEIYSMFLDLEYIFKHSNYAQLALSFCAHNRFFEDDTKEDVACWCCYINNVKDIEEVGGFDTEAKIFNDYEISARLVKSGKQTAVTYRYAFRHKMGSKKGGAEELYAKNDLMKENAEYMKTKYLNNCKVFFNEAHGLWEIRFNFKNLKKLAGNSHGWW